MVSPDTGRREVERPERDIGRICDGMAKNEVRITERKKRNGRQTKKTYDT